MQVITKLYTESLSLLGQLIASPSFSNEEQGTANIIQQFFLEKVIRTERLMNNVWAVNRFYDKNKPTILLNSHHDTVRPDKSYTGDPFDPYMKDGKLYGLGSNDAGGCLVSLMAAFLYFYDRKDISHNLVFAATAEEEISGSRGMAALLPAIGPVACAIVGEPTKMEMAIAEKGLIVIDCMVEGSTGHAALETGENALYKAIEDINWFRTYKFPEESPFLGPVKMTVTMIKSGTKHNVIPAICEFVVDVRVNEHYTNEEVLTLIKENVKCVTIPRSIRLRSSLIPEDHPLVLAGKRLGKNCYGSGTLSDKSLMPFPTLKIGPGDSERSHMADEFIYSREIEDGIYTYIDLLTEILK